MESQKNALRVAGDRLLNARARRRRVVAPALLHGRAEARQLLAPDHDQLLRADLNAGARVVASDDTCREAPGNSEK